MSRQSIPSTIRSGITGWRLAFAEGSSTGRTMDTVVADHYGVLGVAPDATSEQIQQAFRRRSKQCHPDMGGTGAEMMAVIEAWEVLKDPERRAAFDRARER